MTEKVSLKQAARRLGVSPDTIRRQVRSGELRSIQERTPSGFRWLVEVPVLPEHRAKSSPGMRAARRGGRDGQDARGVAAAPAPADGPAARAPAPVEWGAQPPSLVLLETLISDSVADVLGPFRRDLHAELAAHPFSRDGLRAAIGESVGAALDGQAQALTEALEEQRQQRALLDEHEQRTRALLVQEQRQLRVVLAEMLKERDARESALRAETAALQQQVGQLGQQVAVLIMALEQEQRNGAARARREQAATQEVLRGVRDLLDDRRRPRGLARLFRRG